MKHACFIAIKRTENWRTVPSHLSDVDLDGLLGDQPLETTVRIEGAAE